MPGLVKNDKIGSTGLRILAMVMQGGHYTIRELMESVGVKSPNAVQPQIKRLTAMGLLSHQPMLVRTLRPTCKFIPADKL